MPPLGGPTRNSFLLPIWLVESAEVGFQLPEATLTTELLVIDLTQINASVPATNIVLAFL